MSIRAKYFAIDNTCWRVKRDRDGCESVTRQTTVVICDSEDKVHVPGHWPLPHWPCCTLQNYPKLKLAFLTTI